MSAIISDDETKIGETLTGTQEEEDSTSSLASPSPVLPHSTSPWTLFALFSGAVAIGTAPLFVRLSETGPVATAFWRLFLAQPLLWFWLVRSNRAAPERNPLSWGATRPLIAVGLFFAADLWVWHWSIKLTSVANSTMLGNLAPIWVALCGWVLWKQRVGREFFAGMAIALCGLYFLLGHNAAPTQTGGDNPFLGNILGVITAVLYGSYQLSVSRLGRRFAPAAIMAWSGVFASAALLVIALLSGGVFFPATAQGWMVLFGLALFTHAAGQSLIAFALGKLPAAFGSLGLLVQPVAAAFMAWALLGEAIGPPQFIGGLLVLAGIILARKTG